MIGKKYLKKPNLRAADSMSNYILILIFLITHLASLTIVNAESVLVGVGTEYETDTMQYVVLKNFYCQEVQITSSEINFVFYHDSLFGDNTVIADVLALPRYGFLSATPIIVTSLGDLFTYNVYMDYLEDSGDLLYYGSDYYYVHDYPVCNSTSHTSPTIVGQWVDDTGITRWGIYRSIFYFDTSAIIVGTEIINVTLHFTPYESGFGESFDMIAQAINTDNKPFDYTDYNYLLYSGDYGSVNSNDMNFTEWNILRLNPSILVEEGITRLALRSTYDITATPPTPDEAEHYTDDWISINTNTLGDLLPYLEVKVSSSAQIIVHTNIDASVYFDYHPIGYTNSMNDKTIIYPTVPNNVTTHPYYTITFGDVEGYVKPEPIIINLNYGEIAEFTGTYIYVPPLPPFIEIEIPFWALLMEIAFIVGILGFVGDQMFKRVGSESHWGFIGGGMAGLFICAYSSIMPVYWFMLACIFLFSIIWLWRKYR